MPRKHMLCTITSRARGRPIDLRGGSYGNIARVRVGYSPRSGTTEPPHGARMPTPTRC